MAAAGRKGRGKTKRPPRKPTVAVVPKREDLPENRRDLTQLQRERVLELYAKSDRRIAEMMIAEGLFPKPEKKTANEEQFADNCRRTVNNHRRAIRDEWKTLEPAQLGDPVATQEFIARMRSRASEVDEFIDDKDTKPTAKINGFSEVRQIETLIAQASGVDLNWKRFGRTEDPDGNEQTKLPFVGVLMDWKNVSPETRAEIERDQQRRIERGRAAAPDQGPKVQAKR